MCRVGLLVLLVVVSSCVHRPTNKSVSTLPEIVALRKAEAEWHGLAEKEKILRQRLLHEFMLQPSGALAREKQEGEPLIGHIEASAAWTAICALAVGAGTDDALPLLRDSLDGLEACDGANGYDGFYSRIHREPLANHGARERSMLQSSRDSRPPVEGRRNRGTTTIGPISRQLVPLSHITRSNATSQVLQALWLAADESDDAYLQASVRRQVLRIAQNYLANDFHLTNAAGKRIDYSDLKAPKGPTRMLDRLLLLETGSALLPPDSAEYLRLTHELEKALRNPPTFQLRFLHFRFGNLDIPTPSTDFLAVWKLYVLVRMTNRPIYRTALKRICRQLEDRENPFFGATMAALFEEEAAGRAYLLQGLRDFPITLTNQGIDNREMADVKHRWLPRLTKNRVWTHAAEPLPVYRQTLDWFIWKNDATRLERIRQGNATRVVSYCGIDYLLLYWLARRHHLVGAEQ